MTHSNPEQDPPFQSQTPSQPDDAGPQDPHQAAAANEAAASDPEARIAELLAVVEQLKNDKLMALAEAENAGKRADKRIADNAKYAVSNMCKALLQVADNLGRALMAAPPEAREQNETVKNLALGVELTEKELANVLQAQGVRRVESLNQPFDANLHNAVQEVENAQVPSGTVVQVLQDGYVIHDRLLRPAMVVVSRGGPKREAAKPAPEAQGGVDTSV